MKIMRQLKTVAVILAFLMMSCAGSPYIKNYEPVNAFLETKKIDRTRKYILQADKEPNLLGLRIFNGGEGLEHIVEDIDYTDGLFAKKHWEKMYKRYAYDTIKRYWKEEDFPGYNLILEKGRGLIMKGAFLDKYVNNLNYKILIISEPMYYRNRKYIIFYFNIVDFGNSDQPQVVIMKKEKGKWIVVKEIGDYVYY